MAARRKLIIDTDAGVDDAQAILMALSSPDVDVIALTTCHGNTNVDQVCLNVLRVLQVADRMDIPVYKGATRSLVGRTRDASYYHGQDGFGDCPDPDSPDMSSIQPEHAVSALLRLTKAHAGDVTLVCLAPCTNVAMAIRMDPDFGKRVKDVYMMGGNHEGKGNVTMAAEFNFFADPEAAHVVLEEVGCPLTLVTWELCMKYALPWEVYHGLRSVRSKTTEFLSAIEATPVKNSMQWNWSNYVPCDELPMAAALAGSDVIQESFRCRATVEMHGKLTAGEMVVVSSHQTQAQSSHNATVITKIDQDAYLKILRRVAQC